MQFARGFDRVKMLQLNWPFSASYECNYCSLTQRAESNCRKYYTLTVYKCVCGVSANARSQIGVEPDSVFLNTLFEK